MTDKASAGKVNNKMKAERIVPVYRVSRREENLEFFEKVLGMKVLLEDGPMIQLGGHQSRDCRLLLEESPKEEGFGPALKEKRHRRTLIRANIADVEQLYQENENVSLVKFEGQKGFSAISPDGSVFWLIGSKKFKASEATGLADFEVVEVRLNVEEKKAAEADFAVLDGILADFNMTFKELKADLNPKRWDLESLQIHLRKEVDFVQLSSQFSKYKTYLDPEQKLLTVELPEGIELWFEK